MIKVPRKIGDQDVIIYMDDKFYQEWIRPSHRGEAEGILLHQIDTILNSLGVKLTSDISLENYMLTNVVEGFNIDIVVGEERIKLEGVGSGRYYKGKECFSFSISQEKYRGVYRMTKYHKHIDSRERQEGQIKYVQKYKIFENEWSTHDATFTIEIPDKSLEFEVVIATTTLNKETLSMHGVDEIISILSNISSHPDWLEKSNILDICIMLLENTPTVFSNEIAIRLKKPPGEYDSDIIWRLSVDYGTFESFKLQPVPNSQSPQSDQLIKFEIYVDPKEHYYVGARHPSLRQYTCQKEITIPNEHEKDGRKGILKAVIQNGDKMQIEFKDKSGMPLDPLAVCSAQNYLPAMTDCFAKIDWAKSKAEQINKLRLQNLGIATSLEQITENLEKDEYGICVIDKTQLIYAVPNAKTAVVDAHEELLGQILGIAYPDYDKKDLRSHCLTIEFYKGKNTISIKVPESCYLSDEQVHALELFLHQLKYSKHSGERTITSDLFPGVEMSVEEMIEWLPSLKRPLALARPYVMHYPKVPIGFLIEDLEAVFNPESSHNRKHQ